jgi:hypothetical protein
MLHSSLVNYVFYFRPLLSFAEHVYNVMPTESFMRAGCLGVGTWGEVPFSSTKAELLQIDLVPFLQCK